MPCEFPPVQMCLHVASAATKKRNAESQEEVKEALSQKMSKTHAQVESLQAENAALAKNLKEALQCSQDRYAQCREMQEALAKFVPENTMNFSAKSNRENGAHSGSPSESAVVSRAPKPPRLNTLAADIMRSSSCATSRIFPNSRMNNIASDSQLAAAINAAM